MSKMRAAYDFLAGDDGILDGIKDQVKGDKGEPGYDGVNGQKGVAGQKGAPGINGSVTKVVFAFDTGSTDTLPFSGTFPANWDGPGKPNTTVDVKSGECVMQLPSGDLWMYLPGTNVKNWVNTGAQTIGPKGEVGAKGDSGDKGEQGQKGLAGTNGADAAKGQKGEQADKGEKGEKGEKGQNGPNGNTGQKGQKGSKGSVGGLGSKGEKGDGGINGTDGNKGAQGLQGLPGPSGAKGQKGQDAVSGSMAQALVKFSSMGSAIDDVLSPTSSLNISEIRKMSAGTFRVRFQSKLAGANTIVFAQASYPNRADCIEGTAWTATIEVRDGSGNLTDDDLISAMVFHPGTGAA